MLDDFSYLRGRHLLGIRHLILIVMRKIQKILDAMKTKKSHIQTFTQSYWLKF